MPLSSPLQVPLAPSEENMWQSSSSNNSAQQSDTELNALYEKGKTRILTEINREKLPSLAEALKKPDYLKIHPFYQRRERWDTKKKSRLIESFLVNVPVPPIILYEENYNSYEVIDGQQRLTAIRDFYENKLRLTGLEIWPQLNGRTYSQLPEKIKAGIDRRSISSIVVITESTSDPEEKFYLKQLAFERINSGGEKLSNQEVRNCLYFSKFGNLLLELSRYPIFAQAWNIPLEDENPEALKRNNLYKKMEDAELVLRFFALRHVENFRRGMKGFLDLYMMKSQNFSEGDIDFLKKIFLDTLNLAFEIYENNLFRPYNPELEQWEEKPYKDYYDAVMVGLSNHLSNAETLLERKHIVLEETKKIFQDEHTRKILTGGARNKADIQERIKKFDTMLSRVIHE